MADVLLDVDFDEYGARMMAADEPETRTAAQLPEIKITTTKPFVIVDKTSAFDVALDDATDAACAMLLNPRESTKRTVVTRNDGDDPSVEPPAKCSHPLVPRRSRSTKRSSGPEGTYTRTPNQQPPCLATRPQRHGGKVPRTRRTQPAEPAAPPRPDVVLPAEIDGPTFYFDTPDRRVRLHELEVASLGNVMYYRLICNPATGIFAEVGESGRLQRVESPMPGLVFPSDMHETPTPPPPSVDSAVSFWDGVPIGVPVDFNAGEPCAPVWGWAE